MITGILYKNDKAILSGLWEDLIDFVEEIKLLNYDFIDRREFKVCGIGGDIIKEWARC